MQPLSLEDRTYLIDFLEDAIYANQACIEVLNCRHADQGMHKHAKSLYQQTRAYCRLTGKHWPMTEPTLGEVRNVA
jgi:hypothetical protein